MNDYLKTEAVTIIVLLTCILATFHANSWSSECSPGHPRFWSNICHFTIWEISFSQSTYFLQIITCCHWHHNPKNWKYNYLQHVNKLRCDQKKIVLVSTSDEYCYSLKDISFTLWWFRMKHIECNYWLSSILITYVY